MFTVQVKRNDLTRLPGVVERAQREAEAEARRAMLFQIGPAILKSAKERCPVLWGDLRRTGRMDVEPDRLIISFGGGSPKEVPPREYAEYIHEDPDQIERPGARLPLDKKYVYLYLRGWAARPNAEGRLVQYAKRELASEHPKVGMAHFLFGSPESALESVWPDNVAQLATATQRVFALYMGM